jgi:putative peptide zinc metalloprotease protein
MAYLGKRRLDLPGDITVPLPRLAAEPEKGWIADYYRRLRRAAVFPADAAAGHELLHHGSRASGPAVARLALPRGQGSTAAKSDQPGPDEFADVIPLLAAGVEPIGEYQGSGLAEATYLVRNAAGQVVHLSRLLYLVVSAIDGDRTISEVAEQVSDGFGRTVSVSNIVFLLVKKLLPLGLLATAAGVGPAAGTAGPDKALLTLKLRRTIVGERGVKILARLFGPLFSPFVVALVLACLIASDAWLFGSGRIGSAFRYVLLHPLLLLMILGLSVTSMLFHECGHAAACRYGGARPGVIGVGFYVIWPAFFTNVTDAYRLGRAGRIRTDLGGVYFNAIFVLPLTAAYFATGYAPLAGAVMLIHLEIVQQLMPSLRFDGYFILADLIGIPDLFRRIGPTLRSLIPGQPADPQLAKLKRSARVALTAWVLLIVPLLLLQLGFVVFNGPSLARTFAGSLRAQLQAAAAQFGHADIAAGLLTVISAILLILPMAGLSYILLRTAKSTFRQVAVATRRRPARRFVAVTVALLLAAGLAFHWGLLPPRGLVATPRPSAAGDVTVQRPGPASSPAGRPARRARHRAGVLEPVRAAGFDALEGLRHDPGNENSVIAKYAIDGNPATAWQTQQYLGSPVFGGLKKGSGLILDMGRPVTISSVTVTFGPRRGADVSIEVGDDDTLAAATLATFRTVAKADGIGGTHTFRADRPATGRYVLIWFTKLPRAGSGRFGAEIFNVVVRGPR